MKRFRTPAVIAWALAICCPPSFSGADELRANRIPQGVQHCWHVDLAAARRAEATQVWLKDLLAASSWKHRWAHVQGGLPFVVDIRIDELTAYVIEDEVVVMLKGDLPWQAMLAVATQEPRYVQVQHEGAAIHHWESLAEDWRKQLLDANAAEDEQGGRQALCMARPQPDCVVIATGLRSLVNALDVMAGRREGMPQSAFPLPAEMNQGSLIAQCYDLTSAPLSNTSLRRLIFRADQQVHLAIDLQAPDAQAADALQGMLSPQSIEAFLRMMFPKDAPTQQKGEKPHQAVARSPENDHDDKSEGPRKHTNQLTIGAGINGEGVKDFAGAMSTIRQSLTVKRAGDVVSTRWSSFAALTYRESNHDTHREFNFQFMVFDQESWRNRLAQEHEQTPLRR